MNVDIRREKITVKAKRYFISVSIWILIIAIALLIANQVWSWYEIQNSGVIAAGFGAIGTLLLAWVTVRTLGQNEDLIIQQRNRLRNQEAQLRPRLRVKGDFTTYDKYENNIVIELENVGDGKAVGMTLVSHIHIREEGYDNMDLEEYLTKNRSDLDIPPLIPNPSPIYQLDFYGESRMGEGGVLEPNESAEFTGRIDLLNREADFSISEYDPDRVPNFVVLSRLLDILEETDLEQVGIIFELKYEDILGNEHSDFLMGRVFNPQTADSLEQVLDGPVWSHQMDEVIEKGLLTD